MGDWPDVVITMSKMVPLFQATKWRECRALPPSLGALAPHSALPPVPTGYDE